MKLLRNIAWFLRHPLYAGCYFLTGMTWSAVKVARERFQTGRLWLEA